MPDSFMGDQAYREQMKQQRLKVHPGQCQTGHDIRVVTHCSSAQCQDLPCCEALGTFQDSTRSPTTLCFRIVSCFRFVY